jgi:MFS family permease
MALDALSKNRSFLSLIAASTVLGAAMPMLIILGGLAGLHLAPTTALATLPSSLQILAGLLTAAPFSLLMGRLGRKPGFFIGAGIAILGAALGALALFWGNFLLLCIAHFALGAALACYQYFRFAAAETVSPEWQPVAISFILSAGLIAAFTGPQLFIATKDALAPVPLVGAYVAIAAVTAIGLIPLALTHLPKPAPLQDGAKTPSRNAALKLLMRPAIRRAVGLGAVSQGIMVFLMIPTPLAMIGAHHTEALAGDVIRWHVVAMFAPSFITGFLIKRFGANRIAMLGLILLLISALLAASGLTPMHFYLSLIILGAGWNFGFIGATTLLASAVTDAEKPVVQGANDTLIALVSTVCAFAAGALVAGYGWTVLVPSRTIT